MSSRRTWLKRSLIAAAAACGLLLLWSVWALFGPLDNGIPVGPDTTVLTGPLDEYGYVDYSDVFREEGRVDPEDNAAAAIFQVLQSEMQRSFPRESYLAVCKDLGVTPAPDPAVQLVTVDAVAPPPEELAAAEAAEDPYGTVRELNRRYADLAEELRTRPWTAEDHPPFAAILKQNAAALDIVTEGSRRPGYWFWPPQNGTLYERLLPLEQHQREIARVLALRAMLHVGEGDFASAAKDADTLRRVGSRLALSPWLISVLVGIAIDGIAYGVEKTLLTEATSPSFIRERLRVLTDYDADHYRRRTRHVVDRTERLAQLDAIQQIDRVRRELPGATSLPVLLGGVPKTALLNRIAVRQLDPAAASRLVNENLDSVASALNETTAEAFANAEPPNFYPRTPGGPLAFLNGDFLTRAAVAELAPAIGPAASAALRVKTRYALLRVLAAGRLFELEHARHPAAINDLVPAYLPGWPTDRHNGNPLQTRRDGLSWVVFAEDPNGRAGDRNAAPPHLTIRFGPEVDATSPPDDAPSLPIDASTP